uniref:Lysosomal acid phosphatase n=1 Tax=Otus sunia TaxID=257818 RepID=A0A8C8ACA5_9STRI
MDGFSPPKLFIFHSLSGMLPHSIIVLEKLIFTRSTDCDRTLMSAEANLAGLYPPEGQEMFNPNISWQPIPVHTVPESEERLLKFPLTPCPRYEQLQNETRHSAEYINKTKENWQFLQMVANKTGIRDVSLDCVWSVYDTLFCEQAHKMDLPVWVTPDVMTRLKQLKDFGFEFLFGIHKRLEKARLQGGVLLDDIRKNLTRAANVSAHQNLKVLAYSAHDTTLVALQMALDVYNKIQAPYASCHLFELYQEDDGNFSVEMFFRNESGKEPFPLTIPGCQHKCPLQRFLELTDPIVPQDWKQECQVASPMHDTGEPRPDHSVAEGESLDDTMLTICFLPCRTVCGSGCVWIHSPSPYNPPLDCTLSHTVSAPRLPARFQ